MLIMILMTSLGSAAPLNSRAQEILERKVSLDIEDKEIKTVLSEIEKQTSVMFTYRPEVVNSSKKITIKMVDARLSEVLDELFEDDVSMIVVDDEAEIVLVPKSNQVDTKPVIDARLEVSGTVSDDANEPLPGVNVLEKGTTNGTTTDAEGKFSLAVQDENSILVFSFIGYASQEVSVGNQTVFNISLAGDIQTLSEVVVVGYGEQKKETLTGSISNIKGEDLVKSPSANVSSSLAGKLPGLTVSQRTGEPGRDDPNFFIRGAGTFYSGNPDDADERARVNAPLIIVDGVPRSLMSRLNPDDIESISVLKDASAAIYGARAANGVILITTKKGSKGQPVFDFSYNHAFQRPTKLPTMLDAPTFAQVYNEGAWYRAGRPSNFSPPYSDDVIQKYADGSDPVLYPNTDWIDEALKPYSTQQRLNLSATGGTDAVRYFLSFGATTQNGNFRNDPTKYNQYNMRVKVDVNLTKNLTVGANISAILNDKKFASVATDDEVFVNFANIIPANPTLVARYPNGLIGPGRLGENPLLLDQRGYLTREDAPLFSTFTASYTVPFVKGLKLETSYNYDLSHQIEKRWRLPYFFHEYNTTTGEYEKRQGTGVSTPELSEWYRRWTTKLFNFRINYDKTFDKHHVGLLIGAEQQKNTHNWVHAFRRNYVSTAIDQIGVGSNDPEDKNNNGSATIGGYNNYFGRANYDFDGKYLLEFVFRYDGSQRFPEDRRYGFFPGVSAGWRLSEENFIRNNFDFINQLKIRGSYGQIGNDLVDAYQHLQTFTFEDNYYFGGGVYPGIKPGVLPNPNITWETAEKTDLGLEGMFWNGKLGFDFTWWQQIRSDILARRNVSVSNVYGFPGLPDENIGKVKNHGFELVLTHNNTVGQINYQISANAAFARSKILFMDEVPQDEPYKNRTGHPVGAGLFYKADGIFNTQEELDGYPHISNTQLGDIKIVDLNNDGEINGADQFRFDYSATPEYVFGMNIALQYKNLDLTIFFQGQTNAYNYDDGFAALGNSAYDNATVERASNRWTVDNPNGTMPRADGNAPGNNTMWVFDATFVRLKTLELGYSLPQQLVSKVGLGSARFYVSGFNMFTWAKEIKWSDPEAQGGLLYYPQLRVINLGVNVKF
ncbi:MAG TPA: TonB-dependent receptor [Chryseolinea sp.]|nr:TonB-dependent receptor [Chryseolinea sp.]